MHIISNDWITSGVLKSYNIFITLKILAVRRRGCTDNAIVMDRASVVDRVLVKIKQIDPFLLIFCELQKY